MDPHGFVNTTDRHFFIKSAEGNRLDLQGDYCMNGITRRKVLEL